MPAPLFPDDAPSCDHCKAGTITPLPSDASLARCEARRWLHRLQPDGTWATAFDPYTAGRRSGRRRRTASRKAAGAPSAVRTPRRRP